MDIFNQTEFTSIPLQELILNVAIAAVLSFVLRWHYIRFGRSLSNRDPFSAIFPFIAITTLLIITVVKSSLALSLGLIGALSIIRFRTPIKEPEELAYLFVAISIGIGLGANYIVGTVSVVIIMLVMMAIFMQKSTKKLTDHLYLTININSRLDKNKSISDINEIVNKHTTFSDLHRLDVQDSSSQITYFINLSKTTDIQFLINEIQEIFPDSSINFLDQKRIPGV